MEEHPWSRKVTPAVPVVPWRVGTPQLTRSRARGRRVIRVGFAAYVSAEVDRSAPEQRVVEAALRLPPGGVVSGWAALRMHGVGFCDGRDGAGEAVPVPLAVGTHGRVKDVEGVTLLRGLLRPCDIGSAVHGIPVATPLRAAVDAARLAASDPEAVVELDKALGAGVITRDDLATYVEGLKGWKGVGRLRRAVSRSSSRVRSPQETRLRLFIEDRVGIAGLLVNPTILDLRGRKIGEVDLLDPGSGTVFEYDGEGHLHEGQKSWDATKHDRLRAVGLEVVRVTKGNMARRIELERRIDQAVARALATPGPPRWSADLRPLDVVPEEGPGGVFDAETRAWLAGADLPPPHRS